MSESYSQIARYLASQNLPANAGNIRDVLTQLRGNPGLIPSLVVGPSGADTQQPAAPPARGNMSPQTQGRPLPTPPIPPRGEVILTSRSATDQVPMQQAASGAQYDVEGNSTGVAPTPTPQAAAATQTRGGMPHGVADIGSMILQGINAIPGLASFIGRSIPGVSDVGTVASLIPGVVSSAPQIANAATSGNVRPQVQAARTGMIPALDNMLAAARNVPEAQPSPNDEARNNFINQMSSSVAEAPSGSRQPQVRRTNRAIQRSRGQQSQRSNTPNPDFEY